MQERRIFEYRDKRDCDLLNAFKTQLDAATYPISLIDVLNQTVSSRAQRFWVSPERAFNVISRRVRTGDIAIAGRNKRKMFEDIFTIVSELSKQDSYKNESLYTLVSIAVEQPAPCFYMTPRSAQVILHHIKKRRCCGLKRR